MERLPKPEFDFPWQNNGVYDYLFMKVNDGIYQVMPNNTLMYLYPEYPELNHIFIFTEPVSDDGKARGVVVWKETMDENVGEGSFSALCDQMYERGFDMSPSDEPSDTDIEAYLHYFGCEPERVEYNSENSLDEIVRLAMDNFDAKAKYYLDEWGD